MLLILYQLNKVVGFILEWMVYKMTNPWQYVIEREKGGEEADEERLIGIQNLFTFLNR